MAEDLYGGERIRGEDLGVFLVGFLDDKGMGGEEDGDLLWVLAEVWWLWDVKVGSIQRVVVVVPRPPRRRLLTLLH
jgi:hypothetical protein